MVLAMYDVLIFDFSDASRLKWGNTPYPVSFFSNEQNAYSAVNVISDYSDCIFDNFQQFLLLVNSRSFE